MDNTFNNLLLDIKAASKIAVIGHISPDGDAIGACVSMGLMLNKLNKEYTIFIEEPDIKYNFLLETVNVSYKEPENLSYDLVITLDCASLDRLGPFTSIFNNADVTWNIDHHISNTKFAINNHVDNQASSASEVMFDIINSIGITLNKNIAKSLYTGIAYDTGGFKHSNTTSKTLNIVARLIEEDFNFSSIIQRIFHEKELLTLKIQGRIIENMETYFDNQLIISTLSLEDIKSYTNDYNISTGGAVNILKSVKQSKVAILLSEREPDIIRVSLRSEDPYNVCEVASKFGGGGHIKASGARIEAPLNDAKSQILDEVKKLFV